MSHAAEWLRRQLVVSWRREGEPAEPGFELGRPVVALTGLALLLLLGAEAVSALSLGQLWWLHLAAGLVLLPALTLKLAPIGMRAGRYYGRELIARLRGAEAGPQITPPVLVARLVAPLLVADTALLLGSGILMWRLDNSGGVWSTVHNTSAIVGIGLMVMHLAFHVRASAAVIVPGMRPDRAGRRVAVLAPSLVAASIMAGIVIAVLAVPGSAFPLRPHHLGNTRQTIPGFQAPPSAAP